MSQDNQSTHRSEVARLLDQIKAEYEAAVTGLSGLAQGVSRHSFITTRMENMGKLQEELIALVGEEGLALVVNTLENAQTNAGQTTA
jgi:hypothetical protein